MPQPTTIHLKSPVDLISSLPYQLGFHPKKSVVLICMNGAKVGLVSRIDIPQLSDTQEAMFAMVEPMLKERPSGVILLGFEDHVGTSEPLLNALTKAVGWWDAIELIDVLVVRDGRWYSKKCQDPSCCPPEGRVLDESAAVASEFVALGISPAASRESISDRIQARPDAITLPAVDHVLMADAKAAWAKLLTTGNLSTQETQDAALVLANIEFRDAIVAHICPGTLPWDRLGDEIRSVFKDMPQVVPEGAVDRLIAFCSSLSDTSAAPALTVLANYTWFTGDGGLTLMTLKRALRCDPTYRLAQLLDRMVALAIPTGAGK